jgi:hypothetical protein
MRNFRIGFICLLATLMVVLVAGCGQETVSLPGVVSVTPAQGATGIATNTTVTATFSMTMNSASITTSTFTLVGPGGAPVTGVVTYSGTTATFTPNAALAYGVTFTATITNGAATPGGAGLLGNYVWSFTVGTATITTPPVLVKTVPASGASSVVLNQAVSVTFSEAMNPLTLTASNFYVYLSSDPTKTALGGSYQYDPVNFIATFTPTSLLATNASYTAMVTNGATNVGNNPLVAGTVPNPWIFTTGTTLVAPPVVLGPTIAPFGGFAGSGGMTNTGLTTVIYGNSGTTDTAFSAYTGFHDDSVVLLGVPQCVYTEVPGADVGLVTGMIYTATVSPNPITCPLEGTITTASYATTALAEALTAYNTLQGLPSTGVLAGQLGNTTIPPGVYKNSTSVLITGGPVTLDAQGDPNASWVFQIGSTLTVGDSAGPSSVILINGAQAKNVYWAVGSDVPHLEQTGGGTFNGTIISYGSVGIAVSTVGNVIPVTVNGRLISLNASTTLVDTIINVPAP